MRRFHLPLISRSGRIFDSYCEYLVNTINIRGAMGRGLALEFRFRIPEMYFAYKEKCDNNDWRSVDTGFLTKRIDWVRRF
jgi:hypothetical protein